MPIFEKPPLETTITHAAIKACADSNTPVIWMGEEGMRFYAAGIQPNHDNSMARLHATAWGDAKKQEAIARKMFLFRFEDVEVSSATVQQLRGMEGKRVKMEYAKLGAQYGVTWKGRDYNTQKWDLADGINQALSAANASLYALCAAVCHSMGFIPQLGFLHDAGTLPFIYDVADLYKHETSWPAAFQAIAQNPCDDGTLARTLLKEKVEAIRLLQRIPKDLTALFDF